MYSDFYRRFLPVLILPILLLVGMACNLFSPVRPAPTTTSAPLPVEPSVVQDPQDSIQESLEDLRENGNLSLTLTEVQLTELVVEQLASQSDPWLENPQITLRDGQITTVGQVNRSGISAQAELVVVPGIDSMGEPNVSIVSARIGPLPIPQEFLDQVSVTMNDLIAAQFARLGENVSLEYITVGDGIITISGSKP